MDLQPMDMPVKCQFSKSMNYCFPSYFIMKISVHFYCNFYTNIISNIGLTKLGGSFVQNNSRNSSNFRLTAIKTFRRRKFNTSDIFTLTVLLLLR